MFIFLLILQVLFLMLGLISSIRGLVEILVYIVYNKKSVEPITWILPSICWGIVYFISQILDRI